MTSMYEGNMLWEDFALLVQVGLNSYGFISTLTRMETYLNQSGTIAQ